VALGLSASLWVKNRQFDQAQAQFAAQLASNQNAAGRAGTQIGEAVSRLDSQESRIDDLQARLTEASAIIQGLDEALRSMTDRGSELVLLNDVDHLATIAQQQLQLGGNVRNAIVALESAQAQLARANRPGLASLQQTLNGDLDRLRAASTIDVGAFSNQLEELAMLLTEAPLIMPDEAGRLAGRVPDAAAREQPAPTVPPARAAGSPWWERAWDTTREWSREAWGSVREDLGQFIDVRRVDDAQALLMSPDQATRFRDNLRTRVMTAQLALMMRQPEIWKTETEAIVKAIETRYDEGSPLTRKALRMARGMADASIDARLPTVDNTLQALNALREEQALRFHGGETGDEPGGEAGGETGQASSFAPDTEGNAEAANGGADNGLAPETSGNGTVPAPLQSGPADADVAPGGGESSAEAAGGPAAPSSGGESAGEPHPSANGQAGG